MVLDVVIELRGTTHPRLLRRSVTVARSVAVFIGPTVDWTVTGRKIGVAVRALTRD